MALYAFDGTGNEDKDGDLMDSNPLLFYRGYDDPSGRSTYWKGIGTRAKTGFGKIFSEASGIGGHQRIRDGMDKLTDNFKAGDRIVDIVGFSRGAALAIAFANEVFNQHSGVHIRFIGVWDIVAQFGLPGEVNNAGLKLTLPPNAKRVYHAMSMDEHRLTFPLTRLCTAGKDDSACLTECWFRGVHSDVGGGNGNKGLNWITLQWMFQNAIREGLPIKPEAVTLNLADKDKPYAISDKPEVGPERVYLDKDVLHSSVKIDATQKPPKYNNPSSTLQRLDDEGKLV